MWRVYPTLYKHFVHSVLAKRLANTNFIQNLTLITDIFEELAIISNAFQSRIINISRAGKLIRRTIRIEIRKNGFSNHAKQGANLISINEFKCISFKATINLNLFREKNY